VADGSQSSGVIGDTAPVGMEGMGGTGAGGTGSATAGTPDSTLGNRVVSGATGSGRGGADGLGGSGTTGSVSGNSRGTGGAQGTGSSANPGVAGAPNAPAGSRTPTGSTTAVVPLSDEQIGYAMKLVNAGDSATGAVAARRATRRDVRAFGQRMVTEHGAKNDTLAARRLATPPARESEISQQLQADHQRALAMLRAAPATGFDSAYLTSTIEAHGKVLDLIDRVMLPQARTAELRTALQNARTSVSAHLSRATQLQQTLSTTTSREP
jgi:putative membrane protein